MSKAAGRSSIAEKSSDAESGVMRLIAYPVNQPLHLDIVPAPTPRRWMDKTMGGFGQERFAYRCLPLLMANQSGWVMLNPHRFFAVWNGGPDPTDLRVVFQGGEPPYSAVSHFGDGILSFVIPYLFRTPPGYNLLVRGPANMPKDGISALEGLVETDWSNATFSMNWKVTRPNTPIIFGKNEPICMVVPQRRGELEAFQPEILDLDADPDVGEGFRKFHEARTEFQQKLRVADADALRQGWQRNYFRGWNLAGGSSPEHQTRRNLKPFPSRDQ